MPSLREQLAVLYGDQVAQTVYPRLKQIMAAYNAADGGRTRRRLTCRDAMLITYPDQVQNPGRPHLASLHDFCYRYLKDIINAVHLLPFYPYSSDDGFSVIDFRAVDEGLGGWETVEKLSHGFDLMFDAVINHVSAQSAWVRGHLQDKDKFHNSCIAMPPDTDLSMVTRPRTSPLLTEFDSLHGPAWLWTTFSADQVDLNYSNPQVLLRIIDLLLFYVSRGARMIRLDAIAYLWKEAGTSCIHLPQVHSVVQLFRSVLDQCAPEVLLITETNVPHAENISYFGNGRNEAQLVYQFPLPPLTAHALLKEDSTYLSAWAANLVLPSPDVCFFNFTASHDGVGVRPLDGLVPSADLDFMVKTVGTRGGHVSCKANPDGSESPYELNINYFSLLSAPDEDEQVSADRFLLSQAIMLSMPGMPGIYFHSLVGSRNYPEGVEATGRYRSINREKLDMSRLQADLKGDIRAYIFNKFTCLLAARRQEPAFDPYGGHAVLNLDPRIFSLIRLDADRQPAIYCLFNLSSDRLTTAVPDADSPLTDLICNESLSTDSVSLAPLQARWLKPADAGAPAVQ